MQASTYLANGATLLNRLVKGPQKALRYVQLKEVGYCIRVSCAQAVRQLQQRLLLLLWLAAHRLLRHSILQCQ